MMLSVEKSNHLKFQTDWLILTKVMFNLVANLQYTIKLFSSNNKHLKIVLLFSLLRLGTLLHIQKYNVDKNVVLGYKYIYSYVCYASIM